MSICCKKSTNKHKNNNNNNSNNTQWPKLKKKLLKFSGCLILVMAVLAIGAIGFTYIESPPLTDEEKVVVIINQTDFVDSISSRFNFTINEGNLLFEEFKTYFEQLSKNKSRKEKVDYLEDRPMVYETWFYFCNILATTIGRSDIDTLKNLSVKKF